MCGCSFPAASSACKQHKSFHFRATTRQTNPGWNPRGPAVPSTSRISCICLRPPIASPSPGGTTGRYVPWGGTQGCTGSAGQPRAQPFPSSSPQSYSVGLYLVRQMTSAELLQRLKTIGIKHPELCKALGEYFWAGGAGGAHCMPTWWAFLAARLLETCVRAELCTIPSLRSYKNTSYLNRLMKMFVNHVKLPPNPCAEALSHVVVLRVCPRVTL